MMIWSECTAGFERKRSVYGLQQLEKIAFLVSLRLKDFWLRKDKYVIEGRAHAQTRGSDSDARPVGLFDLKGRLLTCSCWVNIWPSFPLNIKVIAPNIKESQTLSST